MSRFFTTRSRRMTEGNVFTLSTIGGRGVAHLRSGWGGGGTPSQVWKWGTPPRSRLGGVPHPADGGLGGAPSQVWTGWGYPHPRPGRRYPPPPSVRRRIRRASTCYTAGGVPLAFTKEDFLVVVVFFKFINVIAKYQNVIVKKINKLKFENSIRILHLSSRHSVRGRSV